MHKHKNLHDFSKILDHPEYMYIDFCHLSPNGNKYISEGLVQLLKNEQPQAFLGSGID
jgi:hypothetical protein